MPRWLPEHRSGILLSPAGGSRARTTSLLGHVLQHAPSSRTARSTALTEPRRPRTGLARHARSGLLIGALAAWLAALTTACSSAAGPETPNVDPDAPPAGTYSRVAVSMVQESLGAHACALATNGAIRCWRDNAWAQGDVPEGVWSEVTAGARHTCGLLTDGLVRCWGTRGGTALDPDATTAYAAVSSNGDHTCAIAMRDQSMHCWGENAKGQASPPTGAFMAVSAGTAHTCGLRTDGTAVCWGFAAHDRLKVPTGTLKSISAGYAHSCGIRARGTVVCWGSDRSKQSTAPDGKFLTVSAGYAATCGIREDETITCWGDSARLLGAPPTGRFKEVSVGYDHACAVRDSGDLECWGGASDGLIFPTL